MECEAGLRHKQCRPVSSRERAGNIFGPDQQKVATTIIAGQIATAGCTELVIDQRLRDEERPHASQPCPDVQVHIFTVHNQRFIEDLIVLRKLLECATPIGCGASAWAEDLFHHIILAVVTLPDPQAAWNTVQRIVVTCRVELIALIEEPQLTCSKGVVWKALQRG